MSTPNPDRDELIAAILRASAEMSTSRAAFTQVVAERFGLAATDVEVVETTDPAFLAIHPNHHFLYAVRESGGFEGTPNGAVGAFSTFAPIRVSGS